MGDQCAPSRTVDPVAKISWINSMLSKGWVVVATDYAGLGTPGTEAYLIGQAEAHDVLNSVRAVQNIASAQAGNRFAVWGHSQGGHSALFTANLVNSYAPELSLVGTVASAPAVELVPLMSQQYTQPVSWVIGPEVAISWPANYPELSIDDVLTPPALNNYQKVAQDCIEEAALIGIVRGKLGQQFFTTNLADVPSWKTVMQAQTAPTLQPNQPLMVAESLTDTVVLPNTTALYIQRACQADSNLNSLWLTNVNHIQLQTVISPSVINWIGDRFADRPNSSSCGQPLPITPAQ
ncbi:MAG: alpha/beta fold hydrolase [Saprospiraceae bacterium]